MAVMVSSSLGVTPNQIVTPRIMEGNSETVLFLDNTVQIESRFDYSGTLDYF
jgi:hypothetical protein